MHVGLFWSSPACQSHIADWLAGREPVLFLTGLSGSGKTSLSQQLAIQYHCKVISMDALRAYDKATAFSQTAVDSFCERHPEITVHVKTHWDIKTRDFTGEKEYTKYTRLFLDEINCWAHSTHTRCIVEGIQLFVRVPKEYLINRPKLIIGTCGWKAFCQAIKRSSKHFSMRIVPKAIIRFFRYHIVQLVKLNCHLHAWERAEGVPLTKIDNLYKMC